MIEEWLFFLGLARRMDLELWFVNFFGGGGGRFMESPPIVLQMNGETALTTEDLFAQMCATSRIPLDEVRKHPHGKIFDVDVVVAERDPDCSDKLDVGNIHMLAELAAVRAEDFVAERSDSAFPFRLIPRRHQNFMNSSGTALAALNRGKPYNPVYMHPDTVNALGLESGGSVRVTSNHDSVPAVLEADDTLRRDVVAMHHAFGGMPAEDGNFREHGTNVGQLVPTDVDYDAITGLPRQGNIAVAVTRLTE